MCIGDINRMCSQVTIHLRFFHSKDTPLIPRRLHALLVFYCVFDLFVHRKIVVGVLCALKVLIQLYLCGTPSTWLLLAWKPVGSIIPAQGPAPSATGATRPTPRLNPLPHRLEYLHPLKHSPPLYSWAKMCRWVR